MKLFVAYCVVSSNLDEKQIYVLSTNKNNTILPIFNITSPRYLNNEVRYNIKNIFKKDYIKFIEQIIVSDLSVQNEILIEYIEDIDLDKKYNTTEDLFLLCGIIIEKLPIESKSFYWNRFDYKMQDGFKSPLFSIIDTTLQKSFS